MKHRKKLVTLLISMMLMGTMVFGMTGCGKEDAAPSATTEVFENGEVLGEGINEFGFTVVGTDGNEVYLEIHTDEKTVGDALVDLGVIAGEYSEYGLYVKTVNGETLDFDEDGKYWAFYINGEYGMTGVDATEITEGASYAFKAE